MKGRGTERPDLARHRRALTPLIPLLEGCFERGELLKKRGWYSFEPYWTFRASLCAPDEWRIHKTYVVESRKEALGNYHSEFLARLRAEHAGADERSLTACDRKFRDLQGTVAYQPAWKPFEDEQMRLRQRESELHATPISRRCSDDERKERVRIWSEVMRERAPSLGFESKNRNPDSHPQVFRRPLTHDWGIALGVDTRALGSETADTIAKPPGMGPLPIGKQITWMALVPAGKSRVHPGDVELIFVPRWFVPFDGAYGSFWDFEGLEINVRAQLAGLEMLWSEMQPRLTEGVTGLQ
jgi:hypothetical protein